MGRVDVVVAHRLVHVLVDVQPVQEHGRVVVRHQEPREALLGEALCADRGASVSHA